MKFSKSNHLPIAINIRTTLAAALLVSCILLGVIGITSWQALNSLHQQIEELVEDTEVKTSLIYDMRIAARERNLNLMLSVMVDDEFVQDEQWMSFRQQGSEFLKVREEYIALGLSKEETELLEKQRDISRKTVALQYNFLESIRAGKKQQAANEISGVLDYQEKVFDVLDELLEVKKNKNKNNINAAKESQLMATRTVGILSFVVVMIMLGMTTYITRRISQQANYIENEALKFKALIEGSMDAVLVLDDLRVIDCNVNALNLFSVGSLAELNDIGLDYLSSFSESNFAEDNDDVFSAINHVLVNVKRRYHWQFSSTKGTIFPADVELTGIEIDGKQFVQMVIRDVTEREIAQRELREANENLEHKVQERTRELKELNTKIVSVARSAGMAEVASGVLHNVGNVLNSVNVSTTVLKDQVKNCKSENLKKLAELLIENKEDICSFLTNDDKGKLIIPYIEGLSEQLSVEQKKQMLELDSLSDNVEHIKNIITMQQSYAGSMGVIEKLHASLITEDAIKINISSIEKHKIDIQRNYEIDPEMTVDKHKLIQVLVNFISNAKYAVLKNKVGDRYIKVGILHQAKDLVFYVEDNGVGIEKPDIARIFEFGYKKREGGHGYGLHHSALVAKELGGVINVKSDGSGCGARFELAIPL